jgi:ferrochelatase
MMEVAEHYYHFGGKSPINDQNRALIAALRNLLDREGPHLPVYWGNRNWHPLLVETLRQMRDDGVKSALGFFTSAYSSYSGCRQYRENIAAAQKEIGAGAPEVHKLRAFYNHPGFIEPVFDRVREALAIFSDPSRVPIAFTAHSIPQSMAQSSDYVSQLQQACRLVAGALKHDNWKLVYQSRSGPPSQPWLEPDILDHLRSLQAEGVDEVVVAPIGFISDHLEVLYDLDTEAAQLASQLGMKMARAATVGTDARFVSMIRDLILERISPNVLRVALGTDGPSHDICTADCCPPPKR